jgi:translation initiation factor IF-2
MGVAEVRDTFRVPRAGMVAGCYVTEGKFLRGGRARLVRDSRIIYEGKVGSLRRFKEDVREVQQGYECGIGLENFNDVKVGDVLETYDLKEIAPSL